jgi:hypothetical protein
MTKVKILKALKILYKKESVFNERTFILKMVFEFFGILIHPNYLVKSIQWESYNSKFQTNISYSVNMILSVINIAYLVFHLGELFYTSNYNSPRFKRISKIVGMKQKEGVTM